MELMEHNMTDSFILISVISSAVCVCVCKIYIQFAFISNCLCVYCFWTAQALITEHVISIKWKWLSIQEQMDILLLKNSAVLS